MVAASLLEPSLAVDLTPRIGAILRVDRHALTRGVDARHIQAMLDERQVLFLPDQHLDDDEQRTFSASLGPVAPPAIAGPFPISLDPAVTDRASAYLKGCFFWHIDGIGDDCPPRVGLLSARTVAPRGGQTEFCNLQAAWQDLPPSERRSLSGLRVVHHYALPLRCQDPAPAPVALVRRGLYRARVRPLAWTDRAGRESLILGSSASHIEGMEEEAGRQLLDELTAWATQPRYVYRHDWTVGDLLLWNNHATMHRTILFDPDCGRLMTRTTAEGGEFPD